MLDLPISVSPSQAIEDLVGREIGPYRLVEKLGAGGFGVVFKALQQQPVKRAVALKIIKPGMDSGNVIARFEAERQALAMMNHPNIAGVLDGGTTDNDRPFFVMELVEGVPITRFCDERSLSVHQRLRLFISVCRAVEHAHQKGLIHRDIKPGNVMVSLHDDDPTVKVIDFGVAKALHQRLTNKTLDTLSGAMVGTPQYMSPEQAGSSELDVDTRSDVYSLAMLLYELLTGTTAIETERIRSAGYREIQRLVCEADPVRPSQLLANSTQLAALAKRRGTSSERLIRQVQGELDWIVLKGLEKERDRRYQSAREFALDVARVLKNQPVHAGPPSAIYRVRKFAIRHRNRLALAAAACAVIGAIAAGMINNQYHIATARNKEESRINKAIDEANTALTQAVENNASNELWTTAGLKVEDVQELASALSRSEPVSRRVIEFITRYQRARADRDFTISMEELLVEKSTDRSMQSLIALQRGFESILRRRGYDLERLSPVGLGAQLREDRTPIKLTDAVELWLATRIKISNTGGQEISKKEIRQWVDSMCAADPHPMRTAIRETVFGTSSPDLAQLDYVVTDANLAVACARKLSWLSEAYILAGASNKAEEIREFALAMHSNDLMLNFENATRLLNAGKADQAVRYFMRCTAIRPGVAGVWRSLAMALRSNNEFKAAAKALQKAIQLDPNHAQSLKLLAQWELND